MIIIQYHFVNKILCVSLVLSFVTFVVKPLNCTSKDTKILTKGTKDYIKFQLLSI